MKYHEWRYLPNVKEFFRYGFKSFLILNVIIMRRWAEKENRKNAPCRVCEYYADHHHDYTDHRNRKHRLHWKMGVG